ncbi:MAG: hypothetical protein IPH76_18915 [Xanthomonadales bacterium]|nr:hypothetical protein [Xanthomonadales bacterium]
MRVEAYRYGCPYGGFLRPVEQLAPLRIVKRPGSLRPLRAVQRRLQPADPRA